MNKKVTIKDLVPDDANFNTGNEFGNSLIDKSLSKFGAGRSILIDKNNRIIAGNKTIENAAANGFNDVVVVETTGDQIVAVKRTDIDLNTKKGREMALADNATAKANISWDAQALTDWDMPTAEWGIDLAEFAVEEVGEADAEPQIDKAAELNKKWKVKSGDLWQIGEHRLLCGDNIHGNKGLTADLCLTDPPYNIGLEYATYDDTKSGDEFAGQAFLWFQAMQSVTANLIVTPGRQNTHLWMGFDKCEIAAWVKSNAHGGASIAHFAKFEPILCYGKHLRKRDCDVFEHHVDNGFLNDDKAVGHPCAKPLRLWNDLIENYTEHGQTVYEPFAGSGTTLVACQNLNRKCYAIEISENYCAVILERMATAFPDIEIKRIDG